MKKEEKIYLFQKVFLSGEGKKVLEELAEFAHADDAEFCNDPRKDAYMQGRRSVIMEIRKVLKEEINEDGE